jgi:uncharacterized protein (TIGR03435 family)
MAALTQALSIALVDFAWQGVLIGLLLWLALVALRNRSANARYAVSCLALLGLAALPILTVATLWTVSTDASIETRVAAGAAPRVIESMPQTMLQIWMVPEHTRIAWLDQVQLWALPIWSIGVLLFSIRLTQGCVHTFVLRRAATSSDEPAVSIVERLAGRIGIACPVQVLVSSLADGPSVIGWMRPAILLPPATAMGLTPTQLEAVLAHELAHIKRHDYLVNMLQVVTETLFFYHPVVWWTSRQIRIERELCCDDIAVRSCGDSVAYARALTTLARRQLTAMPELWMAATGGSLKFRVQRLLGSTPRDFRPASAPGVIVLCVAIASVVLNIDRLQALARRQVAEQPRFEIASVKVNKANDGMVFQQGRNGRYTATAHSLGMLIRSAYQVQEFQIIGGPDWMESDRFDINAKEPDGETLAAASGPDQPTRQQLMLRSLLEERFSLAVHKETRERPVYALVLARSDGRLGPQLHPSRIDCANARGSEACGSSVGPGFIRVRGGTIAQLATAFSRLTNTGSSLNLLVVDRSGLEGLYDAELRFTPEFMPSILPPSRSALGLGMPAIDPNGPSIFTAVQEQLGLKLDSRRGPVEVLVIDRVAQPTED